MSAGALERRLGVAVACWALLIAANDSLPYLGLRDDSCQTMFCSMGWGQDWNSHFFVPQITLSDLWASWDTREVEIEPWPTEQRLRYVAEWLADDAREKSTESTRVVVDQLCSAGHRVSFWARRSVHEGDPPAEPYVHYADACSVPMLSAPHRWIPVRLYDTDSRGFDLPPPQPSR